MTQGPKPNQPPQSLPPDIRGAIYGTGMLPEAEELIANAPDEVMPHPVGNVAVGSQVEVGRWSEAGNQMVPVTVRGTRNDGNPILDAAPPLPPVELPQLNTVLPPQQPTGFEGNMGFGPQGTANFADFGPTGAPAPPSFSSPERKSRQSAPPTGQEFYADADPDSQLGSIFAPGNVPGNAVQPAHFRPYGPVNGPDATPRAVEPQDFDPNRGSLRGPNAWGPAPRSVRDNADNNTGLHRFQRRIEGEE